MRKKHNETDIYLSPIIYIHIIVFMQKILTSLKFKLQNIIIFNYKSPWK